MKKTTAPFIVLIILLFSQVLTCCGGNKGSEGNKEIIPPPTPNNYKYEKNFSSIRYLTYNSFYCKSNTQTHAFSKENTQAFAKVIKSLDADFVAIQELDSGTTERSNRYLLKQINEATGKNYQMIFAHAADYSNGAIGCGLLISPKYSILHSQTIALPGDEKRMLIIAELKDFVIMSTHLDLNASARKLSAKLIVEAAKKYSKPILLAGDLNDSPAWSSDNSCFPILSQNFSIYSATESNLSSNIDYVLLWNANNTKLKKIGSNIVKQLNIDDNIEDLTTVSDHYPVYVDFSIQ